METKKCYDVTDGECAFFIYPKIEKLDSHDEIHQITIKLKSIKEEATKLCANYLWQNDQFNIKATHVFGNLPVCFVGRLNYGANIEDEWFLVHILRHLTLKFEDLIVRVGDSDGEFMLIEAADYLPSWVSPETSEGRVFLHRGRLHILPKDEDDDLSITEELLQTIRTKPDDSHLGEMVDKAIENRIGNYPEKILSSLHDAVVYVPVAVAAMLKQEPSLVTSAVQAFCDRDLVDVKACRAMKFFPPEQCVLSRVKFTKCSYAMLASSKFLPDKRTGWNLPAATDKMYKAHILGIRLACGFEILLGNAKSTGLNSDGDIDQDRGWVKMVAKLTELNYFRGFLEHSKPYNELLNVAQEFYRQNCTNKSDGHWPGRKILGLMESLEVDVEKLKRHEEQLTSFENDDSWMNITREELDEMLTQRFGKHKSSENANNVASQLNAFISHVSEIDGVEFPSNIESSAQPEVPSRPPRGIHKKKKSVQFSSDTLIDKRDEDGEAHNQRVTIDPDGFMQSVKNILDFSIPEDNYWDSDGSGMSSYEDEDEMDLERVPSVENKKMTEYLKEMDRELAGTTVGVSFVKKPKEKQKSEEVDDDEEFEPVDIDMNALKNIILSYKTQMGEAGPSENILGPLGVNLQDIDADVD